MIEPAFPVMAGEAGFLIVEDEGMFIIWGTKDFNKSMGTLAPIWRCDHCQNESHYSVYRRRVWFTLFWIPLFPVYRNFYISCPICNYGKKLKKVEAKSLLEKYGNSVLEEK